MGEKGGVGLGGGVFIIHSLLNRWEFYKLKKKHPYRHLSENIMDVLTHTCINEKKIEDGENPSSCK
jgi:hypothetical protein